MVTELLKMWNYLRVKNNPVNDDNWKKVFGQHIYGLQHPFNHSTKMGNSELLWNKCKLMKEACRFSANKLSVAHRKEWSSSFFWCRYSGRGGVIPFDWPSNKNSCPTGHACGSEESLTPVTYFCVSPSE